MTDPAPECEAADGLPSGRWAWFGLAALTLVGFMYNLSRQVIVLVTEPLKRELLLSDTQIGVLNGFALSLVAALAVFPLGWLTDRADRRLLLAGCIAIWCVGTIGFGLAHDFTSLFGFAMGIAVLEAILGPITYSIIPDLFPRERWVSVNYAFYVLNVLGVSIGLTAAGLLLSAADASRPVLPAEFADLASWRIAMQMVAATAPLAILLVLLLRMRPHAPPASGHSAVATSLLAYFRTHARALVGVFFGFGIIYSANGVLMVWLPPALTRVFDVPPSEVGVKLGLIFSASALTGVAISALWVNRLRARHGELAPMVVAQGSTVLAGIATLGLAFAPTPHFVYVAAALKTVFVTACLSLSPAILQLIAPAHMRGRVIALGGLVAILFMTLSPALVGLVSDHLFPASKDLMLAAATVCVPCFIAGVLLLRFGARGLPTVFAAARD
jgi:MFS family permease